MACKQLDVHYISSEDQVADSLTKPLQKAKFHGHRDKLTVRLTPISLKRSDKDKNAKPPDREIKSICR